jgi:hypothetical protein
MTDKKLWRNGRRERGMGVAIAIPGPGLEVVRPHAAGIDVGNGMHYVAVRPESRSTVRKSDHRTSVLGRTATLQHWRRLKPS